MFWPISGITSWYVPRYSDLYHHSHILLLAVVLPLMVRCQIGILDHTSLNRKPFGWKLKHSYDLIIDVQILFYSWVHLSATYAIHALVMYKFKSKMIIQAHISTDFDRKSHLTATGLKPTTFWHASSRSGITFFIINITISSIALPPVF